MDYRVHASSISNLPKVMKRLGALEFTATGYTQMRMANREIPMGSVMEAIYNGTIIEMRVVDGTVRWLLRGEDGTCVSVSETTGDIITVYWNNPADNHNTLDKRVYSWWGMQVSA
tara:strand:- start:200 stop:544 length:345 start_codon:yes stop_codon:yes gene_type:complete